MLESMCIFNEELLFNWYKVLVTQDDRVYRSAVQHSAYCKQYCIGHFKKFVQDRSPGNCSYHNLKRVSMRKLSKVIDMFITLIGVVV